MISAPEIGQAPLTFYDGNQYIRNLYENPVFAEELSKDGGYGDSLENIGSRTDENSPSCIGPVRATAATADYPAGRSSAGEAGPRDRILDR